MWLMHRPSGSLHRRGFNTSRSHSGSTNSSRRSKACSVEISHRVPELSDSFDFNLHDIPGLHENRRISRESDPCRRSCRDDVANFKSHDLGNIRNEIRNVENQIPRIRLLHRLAVQTELDVETAPIAQLVARDEKWAHRRKRIKRLCPYPLAVTELQITRGHVVEDRITGDMVQGALYRHMSRASTDNYGELGL